MFENTWILVEKEKLGDAIRSTVNIPKILTIIWSNDKNVKYNSKSGLKNCIENTKKPLGWVADTIILHVTYV